MYAGEVSFFRRGALYGGILGLLARGWCLEVLAMRENGEAIECCCSDDFFLCLFEWILKCINLVVYGVK